MLCCWQLDMVDHNLKRSQKPFSSREKFHQQLLPHPQEVSMRSQISSLSKDFKARLRLYRDQIIVTRLPKVMKSILELRNLLHAKMARP